MKNIKKSWITYGILTILVIWGVLAYNKMVKLDKEADAKWDIVNADYQRRLDLIPNLVNTVKGYADFEKETLTAVVEARAKATSVNVSADNLNPEMLQQFQQAQTGFNSALSRLLVTIEKYPELKANQNFLELQAQLEGAENRISNSRRRFIEATKEYNIYISKLPAVIFAGMFGFDEKPSFTAEKGAEKAPEVKF